MLARDGRVQFEQFQDMIARLYPEHSSLGKSKMESTLSRSVTFQVTDACNLACTYCYQHNKGTRKMSIDVAKRFVDLLLSGEKGMSEYVSPDKSPAIIFDFIGGEPFLEVELIDEICDYIFHRMIELDHPWLDKHIFSLCSNGVLYNDPKVQKFLNKHKNDLSFSITIDGNKELHDSCRVFPDGRPSYDIAVAAAQDWMSKGHYMGSKITIAPGNLQYLESAINHMIDLGYVEINANCVYEKGWEIEHAQEFYVRLKRIADSFINRGLTQRIYLSLFSPTFFRPKPGYDLQNWCGGTGMMLSCDPDGYLYPCIRYMESSLGDCQVPYRIGDVWNGIGQEKIYCDRIKCMNCINRRTESTDECFYCPVADGCAYCSAYNYEVYGTPDSRATFICDMHKARALANYYYYSRQGMHQDVWLPKEDALRIISEDEWESLINHPNIEVMTKEHLEQFHKEHASKESESKLR